MINEFPTLYTERFKLRKVELEDARDILNIYSTNDVTKYIPLDTFKTIKDAEDEISWHHSIFEENTGLRFGIAERDTNRIIGTCGFLDYESRHRRAELGYDLAYEFWGKGIMTEVVREVIRFGFEVLNLNRIEARIEPPNTASKNLLHKLGFVKEGTLREFEWNEEETLDLDVFSKLKKEHK
jgi:[ribosomal protein S5]-alanine N-acetyltransferase